MSFEPPLIRTDASIQIGEIVDEYLHSSLVFGSQNLISNSDFDDFQSGTNIPTNWLFSPGAAPSVSGITFKDIPAFTLDGEGAYIKQNNDTAGQDAFYHSQFIPIIEGQRYEASCYTGAHRCQVEVYINWYDTNGTFISSSQSNTNNAEKFGGKKLSDFKRVFLFATPPAGAYNAKVILYKHGTSIIDSNHNSYGLFLRPYFAPCRDNQTVPASWQPTKPNPYFWIGEEVIITNQQITSGFEVPTNYGDTIVFFIPRDTIITVDFSAVLEVYQDSVIGINTAYIYAIIYVDGIPSLSRIEIARSDFQAVAGNFWRMRSSCATKYITTLTAGTHTVQVYVTAYSNGGGVHGAAYGNRTLTIHGRVQ